MSHIDHFQPIVRLKPVTYAMIRLRAIHDRRTITETIDRLIAKGLDYEKHQQETGK